MCLEYACRRCHVTKFDRCKPASRPSNWRVKPRACLDHHLEQELPRVCGLCRRMERVAQKLYEFVISGAGYRLVTEGGSPDLASSACQEQSPEECEIHLTSSTMDDLSNIVPPDHDNLGISSTRQSSANATAQATKICDTNLMQTAKVRRKGRSDVDPAARTQSDNEPPLQELNSPVCELEIVPPSSHGSPCSRSPPTIDLPVANDAPSNVGALKRTASAQTFLDLTTRTRTACPSNQAGHVPPAYARPGSEVGMDPQGVGFPSDKGDDERRVLALPKSARGSGSESETAPRLGSELTTTETGSLCRDDKENECGAGPMSLRAQQHLDQARVMLEESRRRQNHLGTNTTSTNTTSRL